MTSFNKQSFFPWDRGAWRGAGGAAGGGQMSGGSTGHQNIAWESGVPVSALCDLGQITALSEHQC